MRQDKSSSALQWGQIEEIIDHNKLHLFHRSPAGEAQYKRFKEQLASQGRDKTSVLLGEELKWAKLDANGNIIKTFLEPRSQALLHDPSDICIVPNKFPYNFDTSVTHLLVWTKVAIADDPDSPRGDISQETRQSIEKYVQRTFCQWLGVERDRIVWFRNWGALQSVKSISHIHVLIRDLSPALKQRVCNTPGVPLGYGEKL